MKEQQEEVWVHQEELALVHGDEEGEVPFADEERPSQKLKKKRLLQPEAQERQKQQEGERQAEQWHPVQEGEEVAEQMKQSRWKKLVLMWRKVRAQEVQGKQQKEEDEEQRHEVKQT